MNYRIRASAGGLLLAIAGLASTPAFATPVDQAASDIADGQPAAAKAPLAAWIANHPDDARARFLRATALAETGDSGQAITVLEGLAARYAKRADVWNNLGILYARKGQLAKARDALTRAVALAPSDATIQRNLGDIYLASAQAAYDAAGPTAATRSQQLAVLLPALASLGQPPASSGSTNSPQPDDKSNVPSVSGAADTTSTDTPPATAGDANETASASSTPVVNAASAGSAAAATDKDSSAKGSASATGQTPTPREAVAAVLAARAKARNQGNLSGWLAAYSDNFEPPKGQTRAQWVAHQHALLSHPLATPMHVDDVQVTQKGADQLTASWNEITGEDGPPLAEHAQMVKQDGSWQILSLNEPR